MRKLRCQNELWFPCSRQSVGRAAFSLAELVISIGILILMLALAGQVFTITVRSTGQATALTETSQQLRMFEDTLREDLRSVQPGQSLILIQGNPVNAYWTQSGKDADANPDPSNGYGHASDPEREDASGNLIAPRADILMIFTSRKGTSYVSPNVTGRLQQVVYGHAELGEYVTPTTPGGPTGPQYVFSPNPAKTEDKNQSAFPLDQADYPSTTTPSLVPASQWHLARRSVTLAPTLRSNPNDVIWDGIDPDLFGPNKRGLGEVRLLQSETDVIWEFPFEQLVLKWLAITPPWNLPQIFYNLQQEFVWPFARSWLDVTPPPIYANRLGHYFLPNCASFKVEWSLDPKSTFVAGRLDGTSEVFWIDPGDPGDPSRESVKGPDPLQSLQARIDELRKKTDSASNRLRMTLESLLCEQTQHADGTRYSLADRFRGVTCDGTGYDPNLAWPQLAPGGQRPNMEVFTATRPTATGSDAPDDVWPGALRITVDVFDRERRLDRPIRHVIIVPVGG
jgi:type II secretory pathway pseudopilin PulG